MGWFECGDDDDDIDPNDRESFKDLDVQVLVNSAKMRTIYLNRPQPIKYMSNKISTAKYSVFLFIPKFLFEQFRRYANLFFLFIALLQQIPGVSPTGQFTTAIPLLMILSLSAIKEIFEDIKRRRADDETNSRKVYALRNNHWMEIEWRKIVVGDIVKVTSENFFPADLVLLSSSEPRGMCYIETSNLDGETNLKIRQGIPYTSNMVTHKDVEALNGILECELPNAHLYDFVGTLKPRASNPEESYALGPDQMLLRGSMLRNTRWIFGVVIFTGHETKFMLNSTSIPLKRSTVEKVVNSQILMLFIILIVLALICAVANQVWLSQNLTKHWYLGLQDASPTGFILNFLTFVILYNNLIPISLQVTLEIVRFIQAIFIQWDVEMYDAKHNIATVAKTSNLNEELGQVKYIFSDKTGTLTCNEMEFKKCSVGGVKYGDNSKSADKFDDSSLMDNFNTGHETAPIIRDFLTLLAVCHTVVPENDPKEPGGIKYLASSPDELALVLGAKNQGFKFTTRTPTDVTIEMFDVKEKYKILNVLAFSSNRKRMSVIVRMPNGKIRLMIKGADMVIFPRLASQQQYLDVTINHLEEFASLGLRTLCLAVADIDEERYEEWSKEYQIASTSIENRYEKLETAAELIEKDLQLLGATAIEDKLQEGVPDTIASLLKAEIKIWVLTGDKQETAINIGYACQLFTTGMKIIYFNEITLDDTAETLRRLLQELGDRVKQENNLLGLITDGETLKHAMDYRCREDFLSLLLSCKSVICCRMSPLQKAELVNLVKVEVKSITLAIGDGANDVGMIQASHVGVGISGREGLQAACASDYAIGQFRFLKRLLLIHGAWSYSRLTTLILYCFYKNICLYLIEFWFAIISAFSGQILFERWCIGLYNVIFTAATPMAIGLFDQHCSAENLLKYPVLYKFTQSSECFNVKVFWGWCINSIYHSVVFFWLAVAMLQHEIAFADGKVGNYLFLGNMVYTYVVVAVCIKGGLETSSWTWLTHLSIWGSIVTWFLFLAIYPHFWPTINLAPEMVGMDKYVYTCPLFWFGLFLIPCIVLFSDIIWKAFQRTFYKSVAQQVQEMENLEQSPSTMSIRSFLTKSGRKTYMEDPMKDFPATTTEESAIIQEPRGFAFSQEEHGVVEQDHLVRVYDSTMEKPSGL